MNEKQIELYFDSIMAMPEKVKILKTLQFMSRLQDEAIMMAGKCFLCNRPIQGNPAVFCQKCRTFDMRKNERNGA